MDRRLAFLPHRGERATALLVALILTVVMVGFSLAMLQMSVAHANAALADSENLKAFLAAEGGVNESIADLLRGGDGNVSGVIGGVAFDARAIRVDDRYLIDSVGTGALWARAVRAAVVPSMPVPGDRAAITIVGPAGRDSTLDPTTTSHGTILISGLSDGLPAVGISDPETYVALMEDLVPLIADGTISDQTFRGAPEVTYQAQDGSTAEVPITQLPAPEWDAERLEALRLALVERTEGLADRADRVIGAGAANFDSPERIPWGVTVIDGADLDVNSTVSGQGILIVRGGSLNVSLHNSFHWQGAVLIIGEAHAGATLVNSGGTLEVDGPVVVLGHEGRAAEVSIASGFASSNTCIRGPVLLMAGTEATEAADFAVGSGGVNLHGWVGVFGGAAQISATNDTGVFNVQGSMTVGIDGSHAEDGRAEIDFAGNVHVQFNENLYERAMQDLLGLVERMSLPPPSYRVQGWLEISPLVAYQPPAEALAYDSETPTGTADAPTENPTTTSPSSGGGVPLRVGGGDEHSAGRGSGS